MPEIVIPQKLLPKDGRFGSGPSLVRAEALSHLNAHTGLIGTSHRQKPIKNLVARVQEQLRELFQLPDGYQVVIGNGGASAFWDAAAFSLVTSRAEALTFGEFGTGFANAVTTPFLDKPRIISAPVGSRAEIEIVEGIDLYAWPHNETSTGVQAQVLRTHAPGALTVIDATSAAGGIAVNISETDVYYFAPQKNFAAEGGLWLSLMSPAAIDRVATISASRWIPRFLSLQLAIENSRLQQTLNTPAITSLLLLEAQLDWLNKNGGLAFADARTRESSTILYNWAENSPFATPFVAEPNNRSQVVVTIDFIPEVDAGKLAAALRQNGVVDTEPYRKLGRNQLRLATFASREPEDVRALTTCIDYLLERLIRS